MNNAEDLNELIVDELYQQGWSVQPHYFELALVQALAVDAITLYEAQQMTPARIGRGASLHQNREVRQDFIHWLDGKTFAQQQYQRLMENLRQLLNRHLTLGLFDFEAHYAIYEAGAFYKQHYDSFQGDANRVVSVVAYLNVDWPQSGGGELLIYSPDQTQVVQRVSPQAGTLVVFLSEQVAHEVSVTQQRRMSIAGWFRLNKGF